MTNYLVLTILLVISVVNGHGGHERGGNKEGSKHEGLEVFDEFLKNLTVAQREALKNITHNKNLTKAEVQSQLDSWESGLSDSEKVLYQNISKTFQELKTNATEKFQAAIAELNDTTAKTVANEILALINNQSISFDTSEKAINKLVDSQTSAVKKELKSILPHLDCLNYPFVDNSKDESDEKGKSGHKEHGHRRKRDMKNKKQSRAKRPFLKKISQI